MAMVNDRLRRDVERIESPEKRAEWQAILEMTPPQRAAYFRGRFSADFG